MRILLSHNIYRVRGGEETYFYSLEKLLQAKGHEVFTWIKDNKEIKKFRLDQKIKLAASMFWNNQVDKELSSIIKKFRPDVAHFNNLSPLISLTAYHVCKKHGIPIVQTIHSFRYMFPKSVLFRRGECCEVCLKDDFIIPCFSHQCYYEPFYYTAVFSWSHAFHYLLLNSFDLVDAFIFPSKFTQKYYLRNSKIPKNKVTLIPHFLFPPDSSFDNKSKKAENYFLFVGRLSKEKGILGLLDVFSQMPHLKIRIIGDGPLRQEVNQYRNYQNIEILGPFKKNKILKYMRQAFFVIAPSIWYENFGLVVIESFASKTPVIVPNFAAFQETVIQDKSGFFYKHNNKKSLKKTIEFAVKNRKKRKKMGELAYSEYLKKYRPGKYYKRLMRLYRNLIK